MTANVFLASATLRAGNGGIARIARLMSRILAEEAEAGRIAVRAASYLDADLADIPLPVRCARGSKPRFAWQVHKAALSCDRFLYDSLSMLRAHCRLPLLRRPCLSWICGIEVWENANPVHLACAARADVLLSISAYTRDRARRLHGGFSDVPICWLGTDTDEEPSPPRFEDRAPVVTILGRMDQNVYKGHVELIDCWPKVVAAVPAARLMIVGMGPGREAIQQRAAASSAVEHIHFKGFVPDEEMHKIWGETTLLAMPSRGEGFGLVYIEAMRQGLPVLASVHDAAPEVNVEGVTGYNVNLDKADELPERIIYLLRNPDRAALLGRNGQQRWRQHFNYSAFKRRFLPFLRAFLPTRQENSLNGTDRIERTPMGGVS